MIKSLPELPKEMKSHMYRNEWRRKAGMLRVLFLRSKESYLALSDGSLTTQKERQRALGNIIRYVNEGAGLTERLGYNRMNLLDFVHNEENWK